MQAPLLIKKRSYIRGSGKGITTPHKFSRTQFLIESISVLMMFGFTEEDKGQ
jgi:hypothetical protein